MKNSALIAALKKLPPNLEVCVDDIQEPHDPSFEIKAIAHLVEGDGIHDPYISIQVK